MHQALGLCSLLNFRSFLDGHPDSRSVSWEIFQLLFSVTWWLGGGGAFSRSTDRIARWSEATDSLRTVVLITVQRSRGLYRMKSICRVGFATGTVGNSGPAMLQVFLQSFQRRAASYIVEVTSDEAWCVRIRICQIIDLES